MHVVAISDGPKFRHPSARDYEQWTKQLKYHVAVARNKLNEKAKLFFTSTWPNHVEKNCSISDLKRSTVQNIKANNLPGTSQQKCCKPCSISVYGIRRISIFVVTYEKQLGLYQNKDTTNHTTGLFHRNVQMCINIAYKNPKTTLW